MLATASPAVPGQPPGPSPDPLPGCATVHTQREYRVYARAVYLERVRITADARRRLARMLRCQKSGARGRHLSRLYRRRVLERREAWLLERKLTPFGAWAIPAYIVMCESGGSFTARNPVSSAGGAYQVLDSTWAAYGGTRYRDSHPAAAAPPLEQHKIAGRIWRSGGRSQWACA